MQNGTQFQVELTLKTPAKATLCWNVLHKRSDSFHEVEGVLVGLRVFDEIRLKRVAQPGVNLVCKTPFDLGTIPKNLATQAAYAFAKASGIASALHITLSKHIPVGAGLGGGSGNAAGVLQGLNRLYGLPLSVQTLHLLAAELGSDVPFFLNPTPSWAFGRGERLQPLAKPFPCLELLLITPPISISTAQAYGWVKPSNSPPAQPPTLHTAADVCAILSNTFQAQAVARYPILSSVQQTLIGNGALGVVMSGTGSTMLGVFESSAARHAAQKRIASQHLDWWVKGAGILP